MRDLMAYWISRRIARFTKEISSVNRWTNDDNKEYYEIIEEQDTLENSIIGSDLFEVRVLRCYVRFRGIIVLMMN